MERSTQSLLNYDGRVAVVTGGGGGIGRACAIELAARGARVVVNDIGGSDGPDGDFAGEVACEVQARGGHAISNREDITSYEGGRRLIEVALDTWGRLDVLHANAGIMAPERFDEMTEANFRDVMMMHAGGLFNVAQPAFRAMRVSGGNIVVTGSMAGPAGGFSHANYAAGKMAQLGILRTIAFEGAPYGIRANMVLPWARGTRLGAKVASSPLYQTAGAVPSFEPNDLAELTTERVAALVAVLAHSGFAATGQVFAAYERYYTRLCMVAGEGYLAPPHVVAEGLQLNWQQIACIEAARELAGDTWSFAIDALERHHP